MLPSVAHHPCPPTSTAVFCQLAARAKKAPSGPAAVSAAEAAFAVFDPEGTGSVSVATFRDMFSTLSEVRITDTGYLDALVAYADPDMSGFVRYETLCEKLDQDARAAATHKAAKK